MMITLKEFERRVRAHYDSVPAEYREHVSGPEVIADALPHPDLEDNFILGECHHHPDWTSDWTGGQPLRSTVVLYYGSFVELAELDPAFPMDDEIRETVLHEIQHHLEDSAGAGDLHGLDFAQEHNERRRSGHDYAVHFWRAGERLKDDRHELWAVDSDVFLEITLSTHQWDRGRAEGLRLTVLGRRVVVDPDELSDPPLELWFAGYGRVGADGDAGDLVVEITRRGGLLSSPA